MTSREIIEKYIKFYEDKGHKLIPNVSLVPENDPSLLFVNSGMFPLVPYLSGQPHPMGKRLVNVQRSLRLEDIEIIGDRTHTVAFHMIGNWSLGDYFKKEQLNWAYEFLVEVLKLDPQRLYASVFSGNDLVPRDDESILIIKDIFKKYGMEAGEGERIFLPKPEENWWKRGDAVGELGGPDSEVFYYIGEGSAIGKSPMSHEEDFLEIGNSVFMQYVKTENGWKELSQQNVDFGGGLERLAWVAQGKDDIFQTDNFQPIIDKIEMLSGKVYRTDEVATRSMRIIADHIRASVFLAMDGVVPANKDQGYILRRLLRRMIRAGRLIGVEKDLSVSLVGTVSASFSWMYPALKDKQSDIEKIFSQEEEKFGKVLRSGQKKLEVLFSKKSDWTEEELGRLGFDLMQSEGYPFDILIEDIQDRLPLIDTEKVKSHYHDYFQKHQEKSRTGAEQKFKGGLADQSEQVVKYHTATHLIHWALRDILGPEVRQEGSNITGERLRFDFNYPDKLTDDQILAVENRVNDVVSKAIMVGSEILAREDAEKSGALHFFGEKYGDQVKVYYVGDSLDTAVSKEFCGGPHVSNTGELGKVRIYKQEGIGKGKLRVYARFVE